MQCIGVRTRMGVRGICGGLVKWTGLGNIALACIHIYCIGMHTRMGVRGICGGLVKWRGLGNIALALCVHVWELGDWGRVDHHA